MKIYKDEQLNEPVTNFDLGEVEVGMTRYYQYYIHNDSAATLKEIKLKMDNIVDKDDINIIEFPEEIASEQKKLFKFSWTPSLKVKAGFQTKFEISAVEYYSGRAI